MLKRTPALFMCALLIISVITYTLADVSAKTYIVIDGFRISKNEDGSLEIGGYDGESSDITVPSDFSGNAVTSVESRAFADNTSINSVVLPDTMTTISSGAFSDSSITSISIGKNTKNIGSNAFYNCNKLADLDLGTALTAVQGYTFNRCTSLTRVELPETVKSIGEYAFFRCTSLEYILIPPSVSEIAENAFNECNKITIYGKVGSYAQQYAEEFSIPFKSSSGEDIPTTVPSDDELGDVDGNGTINGDDARILQMFCANLLDRSYIIPGQSDVDFDGRLSIKDCTRIERYINYGTF